MPFAQGVDMKKVLFVCMGNICRSPAADGYMQELLKKEGLHSEVYVDSAGTIGYHAGEKADRRMREHAKKRGYELLSISRQFDPGSDFDEFDYIVGMDNSNMADLKSMDAGNKYKSKLFKMTEFCSKLKVDVVPDPYYGGKQGFERVLDIVEDGCKGLLKKIKSEL